MTRVNEHMAVATRAALGFILVAVVGCATLSDVPQSAKDVEFTSADWRTTRKSEVGRCIYFPGIDGNTAFLAARYALRSNDFLIKRISFNDAALIGHHGLTSSHWNVVAGIYFQQRDRGTAIEVIVRGSKSFAATEQKKVEALDAWENKLSDRIAEFVQTESQENTPALECD